MSTALAKLESPEIAAKFVAIYQAVHKVSPADAKNFMEVETFNFKRLFEETPSLQKCTELSVAGTFLEVISNGLSFDKGSKHVYLIPRNVNVGSKENPKWESRLTYSYASDGIIALTTSAKSIKSCSIPVIVYEGDQIDVKAIDGKLSINHTQSIPRKSNTILGGYCTVTLPDGEKEQFWFDISEISRLMNFSAKANKGSANDLYSSGEDGQIDTGFLRTKIVKMALKGKRRRQTLDDNEFNDVEPVTTQAIAEPVEYAETEEAVYSGKSLSF